MANKPGQFKKGEDPRRNTEGRPVGAKSFTTKVSEALEKIAEGKNYTYEEALVKSILKKAIVDGDSASQKLICNYLDGLPTQNIDHTSMGEKIIFSWEEDKKNENNNSIPTKTDISKDIT